MTNGAPRNGDRAEAEAAGYRKGQKAMRERAARLADEHAEGEGWPISSVLSELANDIRNLEIEDAE